jgi:hypothetical protein
MHKTTVDSRTSFRQRLVATASAALLMLGASLPAQAAQIYTTQGYVDYAMNGSGFRLQNSSATGTCAATADAAYWAASRTFNVTFPATATGIDRAYLIWGGSSDVADTTATLQLNGGALNAITGTAQTAARPTAPNTRYYETVANVTTQVAAAYTGPGAMSVTVSNVTFKAQGPDNWRDSCGAAGAATLVVVYTTNLNNRRASRGGAGRHHGIDGRLGCDARELQRQHHRRGSGGEPLERPHERGDDRR